MDSTAIAGHLGELIASRVFAIELDASASAAAIDGRFTEGPLGGRTVNVKWYLKREGLLDLTESDRARPLPGAGWPGRGRRVFARARPAVVISTSICSTPGRFADDLHCDNVRARI